MLKPVQILHIILLHYLHLLICLLFSTEFFVFTSTMCKSSNFGDKADHKYDKLGRELDVLKFTDDYGDTCNYLEIDDLTELRTNDLDLCVIQLNIRGLIGKQFDLLKLLSQVKKRVDVVILEETWLTNESMSRLKTPGYNFVGKIRPNRKGGGVGFLLHESIKYKERNDLTRELNSFENFTVELCMKGQNTLASALYRPPNSNQKIFLKEFPSFIKSLQRVSKNVIVGLDHNVDFLKSEQHEPSQQFIETILDNKLIPLITRPTRITKNSATLIDNILISNHLYSLQRSAVLIHDISDHLPCIAIIDNMKASRKKPVTVHNRHLNPKNILKIKEKLHSVEWKTVLPVNDANLAFDIFQRNFMEILDSVAPVKKRTISPKIYYKEKWLSKGIENSTRQVLKLYKEHLAQKTHETECKYKTYRNLLRKIKRQAKSAYYNEQCRSLKQNSKKLWQLINDVTNRTNDKSSIIEYIKVDNIRYLKGKPISNKLADYFSTIGHKLAKKIVKGQHDIDHFLSKIESNKKSIFITPCDNAELSKLIDSLPNKNSSGSDGISNNLVKELKLVLLDPLRMIFNQSISQGIFPDKMKHAQIAPLLKKSPKWNPSNYRPISLLIVFSKLLEKIMYIRTYNFVNTEGQIFDSQYGFRTNHSCEHAITELLSEITKGIENKTSTAVIFIDLSKAFDTLEHRVLLRKLEKYGIRGTALAWYSSYLTNRSLSVKVRTENETSLIHSNAYDIEYGTPQGSCLGPLLFLLFNNDLYKNLDLCKAILFADDTTIYKSHWNITYLKWCIEEDFRSIIEWFKSNKLTLNLEKTVCMLFSPGSSTPQLKLNPTGNTEIPQVTHTKFLGIWLDEKLNWKTHCNNLLLKLKRNVHLLRNNLKLLDVDTLKTIYYAQIFSHLNYGIGLWGNMCSKTDLRKIQSVQTLCFQLLLKQKIVRQTDRQTNRLLTIEQLIKLENYKFAYRLENNLLPSKVTANTKTDQHGQKLDKQHKYNTRHKNVLNTPKAKSNSYLNSILCKSQTEYTKLSLSIRSSCTIKSFINNCKATLLKS